AVRHTEKVLEHVETIVAIEMLAAAQGIDLRWRREGERPLGKGTAVAYQLIREKVPFLSDDTVLATHIEAVRQLVASGTIKRAVEAAIE
ncbi:MAG: aromatic amino acid lyase, partial [Anaerolineales bacterium]|nr:aromatic amino acid lyase [Anaerolineales bacterium]